MRERTRDLCEIFSENERRWNPRWRDLPRPGRGATKGDVSLDEELISDLDELDETDESEE